MAHKCVVGGCPNSSDTIIHYILPEEPRRRSLWLQFIERSKGNGEHISVSSRVCGDHFSQDSFTQLDLGFTTRLILNVDAVPTIYPVDRVSNDEDKQAAETGNEVEGTCNLTISSTVSLACVKEEPFEYEVSQFTKPREDSKSASAKQVKQEENECLLSAEMCVEGREKLRIIRRAEIKSERGHSHLEEESQEDKDKRFSCSTCGQKFRNKGVLMQHESNHTEERRVRTYRCHHCGKGFALRAFLKAHEKLHEDAESTLTHGCTLCPRRFRYKGSLDAHMRHHTSQVTYKCPVCEEVYEVKGELSQHVKATHTGSKLVCSYCDKSFVRVDAFFKHIDRHVVVTPYYCSTCKVYQLTERGYLCHMRIHEKKRLLRLNAQKDPEVDSETHLTPGAVSEPVEEPVRVQIEAEESLELDPELMLGAESAVEFEETGTDIFPESNLSLPSPQELSYTDTSEDTDDMD
ncbi:histone-lysine N-methyltransferase PRDM9 [Pygocentrus nattereri]|uniref:Uncharacterized protein n=1 Tax=Pygocentrus nattereri TaxID=42514 RepID=A0A3B4CV49_PYGNA|nr:histone-lysine N-methyltransferase PRDM9 [Pygocentrus nattereri]